MTERNVPSSHVLAFVYTSLMEAKAVIRFGGIPAIQLNPNLMVDIYSKNNVRNENNSDSSDSGDEGEDYKYDLNHHREGFGSRGGVVVSLKGPHQMKEDDVALKYMNTLSSSREAVLVLILPRSILWPLKILPKVGHDVENQGNDVNEEVHSSLWLLPVEILEAMSQPAEDVASQVAASQAVGINRQQGKYAKRGGMTRSDLYLQQINTRSLSRAYQVANIKIKTSYKIPTLYNCLLKV